MRHAGLLVAVAVVLGGTLVAAGQNPPAAKYHSPFDLAFSPDGKTLAVTDRTAGAIVLIDPATAKVVQQVPLNSEPACVAWKGDSSGMFVSELGARTVAELDRSGKILRRLNVDARPMGLAVANKRNLLVVCNSGTDSVSLMDLAAGTAKARIEGFREPFFATVSPDESLAVVSNLLPAGSAADPGMSAAVTLVDLEKGAKIADIRLPAGGDAVRKAAITPDGQWLYVVHTVGRTNLPTTQLERGWINTNALSIIDLPKREVYATMLLDRPSEGAADPWGLVLSGDAKTCWISLSGVHQIAKIDLEVLHQLLAGQVSNPPAADDPYKRRITGIWVDIKADLKQRSQLVNDLAALYSADLITRTTIEAASGLRGLALSGDGKLAAAAYFTGSVLMIDPASLKPTSTIALGPQPQEDQVRAGERIWHDATYCFQHWLSCATCHPEARADGMNWDLLNDGIGNPKNAKSMVLAAQTPPSMALGVRANMEVAVTAGFRHILFRQVEQSDMDAVNAFLRALQPAKSPYLMPDGKLSPKAQQGKALFEDPKVGCATCHPAPLFTTKQLYDVGSTGALDRGAKEFDTPTLVELWRTPPYLHDGSAPTLMDVLTTNNKGDKHGTTSKLTKEQLEALVAYLLSL